MKKGMVFQAVLFMLSVMILAGCNSLPSAAGADVESGLTSPMSGKVIYVNSRYGFSFRLPDSWNGYSVLNDSWSASKNDVMTAETGPVISIRHPLWSKKKPRQDIPVMVFTLKQWGLVADEEVRISAAPVGPSELGRNNRYVFALPPRYNYAFPEGFKEVEKIIEAKPLLVVKVK
ncbi:MAG TPA: hypothetical protein PK358_03880 [Spirochaetota bacterium]|nr:hypothetical protein [Spirochaetota bacterium]HPJ33947.1 hypothetical protein [Spirochaetota bacterium]